MARVTYQLAELGTGRKFRVSGSDDTLAGAQAEADAQLAMTCGTILESSQSGPLTGTPVTPNAGTQYSDAYLTIVKAGVNKVIRIENISTGYAIPDTDGQI